MSRAVPIVVLLALLALPAAAQDTDAQPATTGTKAEIRIGLPQGASQEVAVEPGGRLVAIELPRGAALPMSFEDASGGLILSADVRSASAGRVRVELMLAAGYLARVAFDSDALVLTFASHWTAAGTSPDPEDRYLLGADDKIQVTVNNHPELTTTLTVSRNGTVTAPLVGTLQAAGRTPSELELEITDLLGRTYLVNPQVDVTVADYRSQWVMVTGAVVATGRVFLHGGTRLKEVLSEAGGFRENSGQSITISRRKEGTDEVSTIVVDRRDFEAGTANPLLQHGDIVEVAKADYCYVQGEVRSPGRVPLERNTTLLQVISIVGGLTEWADRRTVTILSGEEGTDQRTVNLKRIQARKDPDPVLHGGDIIVVGRRFF